MTLEKMNMGIVYMLMILCLLFFYGIMAIDMSMTNMALNLSSVECRDGTPHYMSHVLSGLPNQKWKPHTSYHIGLVVSLLSFVLILYILTHHNISRVVKT